MITVLTTWLCVGAQAADIPFEVDALDIDEVLPLQVQQEQRWQSGDKHATGVAQIGGIMTITGTGLVLGGAGLIAAALETDNVVLALGGGLSVFGGVIGVSVGPPMLLGGSLRAARSLRERGVMVSTLPGALGWTCLGAIVLTPVLLEGALVVAPALFVASMSLGYGQLVLNRNHRQDAHLTPIEGIASKGVRWSVSPLPGGLALNGTF